MVTAVRHRRQAGCLRPVVHGPDCVRVVTELLDHSQINVTLGTYAHVAPRLIGKLMPGWREGALWSGEQVEWSTLETAEAQADDLGFRTEPPDGIEPSTYALRVRRSSRLS